MSKAEDNPEMMRIAVGDNYDPPLGGACVYLVTEGDSGPCKVGVSANVDVRFSSLQSGNPRPLRVADRWAFKTRAEALSVEREILQEMSRFALVGEWIRADEFGMRGLIARRIRERAAR